MKELKWIVQRSQIQDSRKRGDETFLLTGGLISAWKSGSLGAVRIYLFFTSVKQTKKCRKMKWKWFYWITWKIKIYSYHLDFIVVVGRISRRKLTAFHWDGMLMLDLVRLVATQKPFSRFSSWTLDGLCRAGRLLVPWGLKVLAII